MKQKSRKIKTKDECNVNMAGGINCKNPSM